MNARRFDLEVRTVVVSWKAAVRTMRPEDGAEGAAGRSAVLRDRALALLDGVEERHAAMAATREGRATMAEARARIRAGDVSVAPRPGAAPVDQEPVGSRHVGG